MSVVTMPRQNIVGNNLDTSSVLGLTLINQNLSSNTATNTVVTPNPMRMVALINVPSGGGTLKASVFANGGSPDFSSPTASLTLASGSAVQALSFVTTSSLLSFALRIDPSGSPTVTTFAVLTLNQLGAGESWSDVTSGVNSVESEVTGDGSGSFSLDPSA